MHYEARSLKEALYRTVHHNKKLSIDEIAEQLNIRPNYLYKSVLPDPDTDGPNASGARFMIKLLIPLIMITGDFQALDYIERKLGRVAIPLPDNNDFDIKVIQERAVMAAAEFGDLMKEVAESIGDDNLSKNEIDKIHQEGYEAVQAIMKLVKTCDKEAGK